MTELITKALVEADASTKELEVQMTPNKDKGQPRKTAIFGKQEG